MTNRELYLVCLALLFLIGLTLILATILEDLDRVKRLTEPKLVWSRPIRKPPPGDEPDGGEVLEPMGAPEAS